MILFVDDSHFLVAVQGRDDWFVLLDPPEGPKPAAWSSLDGRWRGEALVVGKNDPDVQRAIDQDL